MSRGKTLFFLLLVAGLSGNAQKLKKADLLTINNLKAHVNYLADDKLEGRRVGTAGEQLAMQYIKKQFESRGLQPKGDGQTFFQAFEVWDGDFYQSNSHLFVNDEEISTSDFFPFPSSPAASIKASSSMALKEPGVPWILDLKDDVDEARENPHFNIHQLIESKAKDIAKKNATALIVYNSDEKFEELRYDPKQRSEKMPIPVLYISRNIAMKYFEDETAELDWKVNVRFDEKKRTGHNVIGYIDNQASTTVIIGAHYDHLGYGEDGNSLYRTGEKSIHNGADDNASGVSALIELSGMLKKSKFRNNNYLFIAFSGEELGLFGSKFFVEHPTVDLSKANYMINLDMVGRMEDHSKVVTIGGYGTSPAWPAILDGSIKNLNFTNKYDSSGAGPSDHTSFYRKDIPVLFFFTGLHSDYHKPTDDVEKINFNGKYRIVQYIYRIIEAANKSGRLPFSKTREQQTGTTARFSVTLGIMPDYTFSGTGVKVDGISEGRPAQLAGLKTGDVVIQLGDYPIGSMENYMQALAKFKKGDKATVKVKRAEGTVEAEVVFQ
jgi:hypothetical protein